MERLTVGEVESMLVLQLHPVCKSIQLQSNNTFLLSSAPRAMKLDDAEVRQFCDMLMNHARVDIEALSLSFLKLGDVALNSLATLLKLHPNLSLTRLELSGNHFSSQALCAFLSTDKLRFSVVVSFGIL